MVRRRGRPRRSYAWLRKRKYAEKWTHKTVPIRFKLLQPPMSASIETELPQLDYLEVQVFALLESLGVEESEWQYYMAAAKRMFAACKHFWFETWIQEVTHIIEEFVERGYDEAILQQLADIASEKCELARPDMPPLPPIYTPPPLYPPPPTGFSQASLGSFAYSYNRKMVTLGTRVWIFWQTGGHVYVASADLYDLSWVVEEIYDPALFNNCSALEPAVWQQGNSIGIFIETRGTTSFYSARYKFRRGTLSAGSPSITWNIAWTNVYSVFIASHSCGGIVNVAKTRDYWWVCFSEYMVGYRAHWHVRRSNDGGLTWVDIIDLSLAPPLEAWYRYTYAIMLPDGDGTADNNLDLWLSAYPDTMIGHYFHDGTTLYGPIWAWTLFLGNTAKHHIMAMSKDLSNRSWLVVRRYYPATLNYDVSVYYCTRGVGANYTATLVQTLEALGTGQNFQHFSICVCLEAPEKTFIEYEYVTDHSLKLWRSQNPWTTWNSETLEGAGVAKTGTNLIYYPYTDWLIPVCYAEAAQIMYSTIYSPE